MWRSSDGTQTVGTVALVDNRNRGVGCGTLGATELRVRAELWPVSCSYVPSWWPQANADSGEACPDSVQQAASDEGWVRDRLASIKDKKVTTGVMYDEDGSSHQFGSGRDDDADTALKIGWNSGVFPQPGRPNVVDHVEVKVAAAMRQGGVRQGVLVINNAAGPCDPDESLPYTCVNVVPKILAKRC
jgi:nucleic acid/nucleotide deaminase of polymorphic system toxin